MATPAYHSTSLFKARRDFHPVIKDKTVSIPVLGPAIFQIAKNSPTNLIHLAKSVLTHPGSGFLATHPTGAKSHNRFLRVQNAALDSLADSLW